MSQTLPSAEVAADFRDALQDLKVNSRPEISNLTIIAKENTEHAQEISRELENHIQTARPEWRLPALYVLDSIVKNVGSPYTVYLGRNLYRTFMDAYTLMDMPTRKAMEGLLKTWKQPVPDSLDTRPVFPVDVTREIENTLIKYRTVAIQQQQARSQKQVPPSHLGGANPAIPWRNTPTPPQNASHYSAANDPRVRQSSTPQPPQPFQAPYSHGTPVPPVQPMPNYPGSSANTTTGVDANQLNADVGRLISTARNNFAANPYDNSIQTKLKALLDLQAILKGQHLTPEQLKLIQTQIVQLSPPPVSAPVQSPPPPQAAEVLAKLLQNTVGSSSTPVPPPTPLSLSQLLQQTNSSSQPSLASLVGLSLPQFLQHGAGNMKTSTPQPAPQPAPTPAAPAQPPSLAQLLEQFAPRPPPQSMPPMPLNPSMLPFPPVLPQPTSTPTPASSNPPLGNVASLLDALRAQNLLPSARSITPSGTHSAPPLPPNMMLPTGMVPPPFMGGPAMSALNSVELTTASMKMPRPALISTLYDTLPNQCSTCGRRFTNTAEGKAMKAKHMDWHFKVKDPDLARRGVHRSWYISEREWIEFKEQDEASLMLPENGDSGAKAANAPKEEAKDRYIHVPTDTQLVNAPCPICQEQFRPHWHPEVNDFVWMDAVKVNGKVYHATCWEEFSRGSTPAPQRVNTPDSVLGKRKAEGTFDIEASRIKMR